MRENISGKIRSLLSVILVLLVVAAVVFLFVAACAVWDYMEYGNEKYAGIIETVCALLDRMSVEAIIVAVSLILLLTVVISLLTRKAYPEIPTMEFYAPEGLNPAEIGYIIDGHVTANDMTSLIYYWASHGHLSIRMTGENSFTLRRLSELDGSHTDYERKLFSDMWYIGGTAKRSYSVISDEDNFRSAGRSSAVTSEQLNNGFNTAVNRAYRAMRASFDKKERRLTDSARNRRATLIPAAVGIIAMLLPLMQYAQAVGLSTFVCYGMISFLITFMLWGRILELVLSRIGFMLFSATYLGVLLMMLYASGMMDGIEIKLYPTLVALAFFLATGLFEKSHVSRRVSPKASRNYSIAAYVLCTAAAAMYVLFFVGSNLSLWSVILFALTAVFCLAAAPHIRSYTEYGAQLVARCDGFKHFLETAEKDRLEMLLADDPDYYYNILPYAHVLGVSGVWMQKTDGLNVNLPGWFSGEYTSTSRITSVMMAVLEGIAGSVKKGARRLRRS